MVDEPVDVIKIDVEGAEPAVFAGAKDVFAANPRMAVIFEHTPGVHGPDLLRWFVGAGFRLHTINRWGIPRPVADLADVGGVISTDLLAAR